MSHRWGRPTTLVLAYHYGGMRARLGSFGAKVANGVALEYDRLMGCHTRTTRRDAWRSSVMLTLVAVGLMLLASWSGCDSSRKAARHASGFQGTSARPVRCYTDPRRLALRAVNVARALGYTGVISTLTMDKKRFGRFMARATSGRSAEILWRAHRVDMAFGIKSLAVCRRGPITIRNVVQKGAAVKFYKVYCACTRPDGSQRHFKVKLVQFEGCLYVGHIG